MNVNKRICVATFFDAERQREMERPAEEYGKHPSAFLSIPLCASAFYDPPARHAHTP